MEEWSCGEGEEFVVCIDKKFGEVIPPTLGIQFLSLLAARSYLSIGSYLLYTLALAYPADRQEDLRLSSPLQDKY